MGAKFDESKEFEDVPDEVEPEETPKVFGDPKSYEHLPMEERKAMTERMKGQFFGLMQMTQHLGDPAKRQQRSKDGESK